MILQYTEVVSRNFILCQVEHGGTDSRTEENFPTHISSTIHSAHSTPSHVDHNRNKCVLLIRGIGPIVSYIRLDRVEFMSGHVSKRVLFSDAVNC